MLGPLLQSTTDWTTARLVVQAGEVVGALLGVFIAYQAYRGYRRNDSKPMLFIAAGFTLILGVPIPLYAGYLFFSLDTPVYFQGLVQLFEVTGLLCIVHALRVEP